MLKNSLNRKYKIYILTGIDNSGVFKYLDDIFENLLVLNPSISSQFKNSIIYMLDDKNYFEVLRVSYNIFNRTSINTLMVREDVYQFLSDKNLLFTEIENILKIYICKYFTVFVSSVEKCVYRYKLVEKENYIGLSDF